MTRTRQFLVSLSGRTHQSFARQVNGPRGHRISHTTLSFFSGGPPVKVVISIERRDANDAVQRASPKTPLAPTTGFICVFGWPLSDRFESLPPWRHWVHLICKACLNYICVRILPFTRGFLCIFVDTDWPIGYWQWILHEDGCTLGRNFEVYFSYNWQSMQQWGPLGSCKRYNRPTIGTDLERQSNNLLASFHWIDGHFPRKTNFHWALSSLLRS